MGKTKKVGRAGRFGARYGRSIKKRVLDVEIRQKQKHACPKCGFMRVKRINRGIFTCTKCGNEFAGGAYLPKTMAGGIISKMVSQRKFVPAELEALKEGADESGAKEPDAKGGKGRKEKPKKGRGKEAEEETAEAEEVSDDKDSSEAETAEEEAEDEEALEEAAEEETAEED